MMYAPLVAAILAFTTVSAHMQLSYPAPYRAQNNPFTAQAQIDYSYTSPLTGESQYPCKGYVSDFKDATTGKATASWTAGESVNMTIIGGAVHGGGSCQVALSTDGTNFNVIHSFIGSCPLSSGENFSFDIPSDAPTGNVVFLWNWFNAIGNREIYSNCATVSIAASKGARAAPAVAFSARPTPFVANVGNGCTTIENAEVIFPSPGPDADVTTKKTMPDTSSGFTGTCAAVGGSSSSNPPTSASPPSDTSAASSVVVSTMASTMVMASSAAATAAATATSATVPLINPLPVSSAPASVATSASGSAPTSVAAPAASGSASGGLSITTDGTCGGTKTCAGSAFGACCSQWGFCGVTTAHCGTGCEAGFGTCGSASNSSSTPPSAKPKRFVEYRRKARSSRFRMRQEE